MSIHSTAVIDSCAEIHEEAEIGPYVVVEGPVKIGRGTRVMPHATLMGHTEIGEQNEIHPGGSQKLYRDFESPSNGSSIG